MIHYNCDLLWVSLANINVAPPLRFSQFSVSSSLKKIEKEKRKAVTVTLINVMKAVLSWPLQAASQTPAWTLRRVTTFSHWSPSLASCSPPHSVTGPRPHWLRVKFEVQGTQGRTVSADYTEPGGTTDSRKSDGGLDIYRLCTFLSFNTQTADVPPAVDPTMHSYISCSPLTNYHQHYVS